MVPVLDCTDKILVHFSDTMQKLYEPLLKSKEEINREGGLVQEEKEKRDRRG